MIYCANCGNEFNETHITDDLEGNIRQYLSCECGNEIYIIIAKEED